MVGGRIYCYLPGTIDTTQNSPPGDDLLDFKYCGDITAESVVKGDIGPQGPTGSSGIPGVSSIDYLYITTSGDTILPSSYTKHTMLNVVNMTNGTINIKTPDEVIIRTLVNKYTYASLIYDVTDNSWQNFNL